jgi:sulfoquinovosyltransferase
MCVTVEIPLALGATGLCILGTPQLTALWRVTKQLPLPTLPPKHTDVSGYNTRFKNTIAQMVAQGVEVLCVTTGAGRTLPRVPAEAFVDPPATYAGAKVLGAPSFGCPLYWRVPLSFGATRKVLSELTAFKPDVIHVTSPGVMLFAAWAYARLLDVPLVMSYHTHVPEYLTRYHLGWLKGACWSFLRAVHSRAHVTMTVSASLAKELVQQGASHGGATFAWRKAVDTEAFHPAKRSMQARARLLQPQPGSKAAAAAAGDVDPAAPLLIYVGRLAAEKKVESLHPLLASLPRNVRLALVGDGPERQALEELFEGDEVTRGRVHFVGALTGEALWSAFASADVAVMPSETETLGNVVLEAMASGVPVVAVAAGGIPDIITQPGDNGFLYPPGRMDTAASQVARLLASPELRGKVTNSARLEAEKWGWGPATQAILLEQYPLAMALHRAGLHRRGDASKLDAAGANKVPGRVRLVSTAAKLAALRGVSTMRTAARSRRAGKLVRRALSAVA